MSIGTRVKIAMLQAGITQKDVTSQFGFDRGDVSRVVNGKRDTVTIRQAIATLVNQPVNELFAADVVEEVSEPV